VQSTLQTVRLDDGATTTVESWGAGGPVILCVHGMTSSRKAWEHTAQHFGDRCRVVAYDQRGHGDSSGVAGPMTLARGVRDLVNVAAITGADFLIGHSWGGAVVIGGGPAIAGVEKIAAIDPALTPPDDQWFAEYIEELEETFALTGAARDARTREDYAEWPPIDVAGKVHAVHAMTTAPIAGLRDENRAGWDERTALAAFPKPLLLLLAGKDGSIIPEPTYDEIRAHHGSNVAIVVLEDQGHNLYRTAFERYAAAVEAFFAV
jgi:pimeloyl-ACP methyl ester carboxylesterase